MVLLHYAEMMESPDPSEKTACSHAKTCEMYSLFEMAGTLRVWQVRYCSGNFSNCARYKMAKEGRSVPINLLPNGQILNQGK